MGSTPAAEETRKKKTLILRSNDGREFTVDEAAATMSAIIKYIVEDLKEPNVVIPLKKVNGEILELIRQYCDKHKDSGENTNSSDDLEQFDANFMNVDQSLLCQLILAKYYLDIPGLFDLICKGVAEMIRGKTPEAIRRTFNIQNDFTAEEENKIRREHLEDSFVAFMGTIVVG